MSLRSSRSSISPFRSRKAPTPPASKLNPRPTTPSSTSSSARPSTPSSSCSSRAPTRISPASPVSPSSERQDIIAKSKENVTVTVRFRPLSAREINKGDEIAWFADGDYTLRNTIRPSLTVLASLVTPDRVFGPATTTRHVYDVAAQHVRCPCVYSCTRMVMFLGRKMQRHLFLHVDPKHNTTNH